MTDRKLVLYGQIVSCIHGCRGRGKEGDRKEGGKQKERERRVKEKQMNLAKLWQINHDDDWRRLVGLTKALLGITFLLALAPTLTQPITGGGPVAATPTNLTGPVCEVTYTYVLERGLQRWGGGGGQWRVWCAFMCQSGAKVNFLAGGRNCSRST